VPHRSRVNQVVIDVAAPDLGRELEFWRSATGRPLPLLADGPEFYGSKLHGQQFALLVQELDDGASRVHLDIFTDDVDAEVERLERLGAQRVQQSHDWWIMRDPAGLPFCVIPAPAGTLTDENSQRWD
jgi:hypothetical protein